MAPEQGLDSKTTCEKEKTVANEEGSTSINYSDRHESTGWIYLLRKEQLIEQCKHAGIATTGFTVDHLRRKLAESIRSKRLRASTENLLRELEDEIRTSENSIIGEEGISVTVPAAKIRSVPDMDVMSTVQKWNLQFSGDSDLMEFLERVEELAECYKIPCDRLLPSMLGILSGNALRWYRVKRDTIHTWAEFRTEVQKFFLPSRHLAQIEQSFYNRKQNTRERAKDFVLSMLTLARQHPVLRQHDHVDRIYDGLRSEYRYYVRRHDFANLDQLIELTDEFEALKREERTPTSHMVMKTEYKRESTCWRCKRTGHRRNTCSFRPRLFCSYCGKDGVFSRSCECHLPNISKGHDRPHRDNRYYIPVTINGLKVNALIDTGASRTYISRQIEQYLRQMGTVADNDRGVVQLADRTLATDLKIFRVTISYEGHALPIMCSEIPSLAEDVILGMDFLSACGIKIFLNGGLLPNPEETKQSTDALHVITSREFLTSEENSRLRELFDIHQKKFERTTGLCTLAKHVIYLKHHQPIKQRYMPRNPAMMEIINTEVDKLLAEGRIEPSKSAYSSPVVLARKKNGGWRMCIDYRQLNAASEPDAYPLPQINNILDQLREARFISSLDLKNGYWQIPLAPSSKQYTAFTVPGRGLFQWKVMPFGLHSAPATFQRALDNIIGTDLHPRVFVYLDDIIVLGRSFDEHLDTLDTVFTRLQKANMMINFDKCDFVRNSIRYLGHVVTSEGIHTDPDKIEAIQKLPVPNSIKELRRILGVASWYRRFVPNFSVITAPMTQLLKKNENWVWGDAQQEAFDSLKRNLTQAPILSCPNFTRPFFLQTDASQEGLGVVLFQRHAETEAVIAYASRTLTDQERKYSTTEQECLAILWGIRKMRPYLEGYKFTVITDHHSLKWLHTLQNPSGRLARWALELQQYDFNIEYRKGSLNVVADCLSRAPLIKSEEELLMAITSPNWYQRMMEKVSKNSKLYPDFQIIEDKLFKHIPRKTPFDLSPQWKLCIPSDERIIILREAHDAPSAGHLGIQKTLRRIHENYYWPGMYHDVTEYVRSCDICARYKPEQRLSAGEMSSIRSYRPWDVVAADFIGPLPRSLQGNTALLVIIDLFSKWVELVPTRQALAKDVVKALRERIIFRFGCPTSFLSDNGVQFTSKIFENLLATYGIKHLKTAPYSPHENPTERMNRTVKTMIGQHTGDDHRRWDQHLPEIAFAINTAISDTNRLSPAEIVLGVKPNHPKQVSTKQTYPNEEKVERNMNELWGEVAKRKQLASQKQAKHYNLRKRPWKPMIGSKVWKKERHLSSAIEKFNHKLAQKYTGPYTVVKIIAKNIYEISNEDNKGIRVNLQDLKPVYARDTD